MLVSSSLLAIALGLALAAGPAAALPGRRNVDLQECVEKALGTDGRERLVAPGDATYTDARIGEHIQYVACTHI
jgi:hypothetical protein